MAKIKRATRTLSKRVHAPSSRFAGGFSVRAIRNANPRQFRASRVRGSGVLARIFSL
ncbi:hypothetical protein KAI54_03980 [Candidatus Gracilibacteria bacterium]|nr:hypothetical protein [Candidatus Gracilibacteria bacterium]